MSNHVKLSVRVNIREGATARLRTGELCSLIEDCQDEVWKAVMLNDDFTWKRKGVKSEPMYRFIEARQIQEILRSAD